MIIRILLFAFVLVALGGLLRMYRRRETAVRNVVLGMLLWSAIGFSVLFPDATTWLAQRLGVGRGLDLLLTVAVAVLFYLVFRIAERLERLERTLTAVVREIAISSAEPPGASGNAPPTHKRCVGPGTESSASEPSPQMRTDEKESHP